MGTSVTPYQTRESKKQQVASMFNNIAARYDLLNHFLSMGIDITWRKKAINCLRKHLPSSVLDIATGTGDFAIEALRLNPDFITGVDISEGMLEKGREKLRKRQLDDRIELKYGDSEDLPFDNDSYEAITVGFGVRNFENLEQGLSEMLRVLKPEGVAVILEFSKPTKFPVKQSFQFYSRYIIPTMGRLISKDQSAYTYLPESVAAFPEGDEFLQILAKVGYNNVCQVQLSGGIASIYLGRK